jgi:hypothetical protein
MLELQILDIDQRVRLILYIWPRFHLRADSLKDDWYFLRRPKPVFDKKDFGQTNEQQRHFNE